MTDVTKSKSIESKLVYLAYHDPLTGPFRRHRLPGWSRGCDLSDRPGNGRAVLGEGSHRDNHRKKLDPDDYYARNWSVWFGLVILARSVRTDLFRRGAC